MGGNTSTQTVQVPERTETQQRTPQQEPAPKVKRLPIKIQGQIPY